MRATINGTDYDTNEADFIAEWLTHAETIDTLYRTRDGEFFLVEEVEWLDGVRLPHNVAVESRAPELLPSSRTTNADRSRRIRRTYDFKPLTAQKAMKWCIQTLMPETFRGYLLECI